MAGGFTEFIRQITFEMYTVGLAIALALFAPSEAAPGEVAAAGSAQISGSHTPRLISYENGTLTVNFLGFQASAGLGGLLTGNMADGGPHAEVETPFGQRAGAGIGGSTDEAGINRGYKYSYAQSNFPKLSRLFSGTL